MPRTRTPQAVLRADIARKAAEKGTIKVDDIVEMGYSRSTAYSGLSKMCEDGEITRLKIGSYVLPDSVPTTEAEQLHDVIVQGNGAEPPGVVQAYRKSKGADARIQSALEALYPNGLKNVNISKLLQWFEATKDLIS